MTTRTKLGLCAGLLVVVAGIAITCVPGRKPTVELSFVRYANDGTAVLLLTNRGRYPIMVMSTSTTVRVTQPNSSPESWHRPGPFFLPEHAGFTLLAEPTTWATPSPQLPELPAFFSLHWQPLPARVSPIGARAVLRQRVEEFLQKLGILSKSKGGDATASLPPR